MAYAGHTWTTGDVITAVLLNALDTSYTALNAKAQVNGDILELYHGANKKFETSNTGGTVTGVLVADGLTLGDSENISLGVGGDFLIAHDGTYNNFTATSITRFMTGGGETIAQFAPDAAVSLYYNNSVKLATTDTGIDVTGTVRADELSLGDSEHLYFGADNDLSLYHNGTTGYLMNKTGSFFIYANSTEYGISIVPNSAVRLYYNNTKKLETATDGVAITGACKATNFEVGNNIITDSTTTRTFALTDNGMYIRFTSASDVTATIPLNSAVAFPIGTIIECINAGDSDLTITKTAGVTLNSADTNTKLTTQFKAATLKKVATDIWDVIGLEE